MMQSRDCLSMNKSDNHPPSSPIEDVVLSVSGLKKSYGTAAALSNVDISVRKGEIFGFLGKNGAGKSTTIKILAGLVKPDQGEVTILGRSGAQMGCAMRAKIGFLIENPCFQKKLNAVDNLICHALLQQRKGKIQRSMIDEMIDMVGLKDSANRAVGGYSTGMRQRLGLAQAFMGNPEFIILDEPLNGLDPEGILHVREMIKSWAVSKGVTFLISSHILAEVEQLCDCVGFIKSGRTVAQGRLDDLGATGWVRLIISDPTTATNLISEKWPDIEFKPKNEDILDFRMDEKLIPQLVRLLSSENLDIYSVSRRPRSLEEIFIEQTGSGK